MLIKSYPLDILTNLQRLVNSEEFERFIPNRPWVLIDNESNSKLIYRFRDRNNELLISENGNVIRGNWEFLEGENYLLIEVGNIVKVFRYGYIDDTVLALKLENDYSEFVLFFNEINRNKIGDNSLSTVQNYFEDLYKPNLVNDIISRDKFSKTYNRQLIGQLPNVESFKIEYFPLLNNDIIEINRILGSLPHVKHSGLIISEYAEKKTIQAELLKYNDAIADLLRNDHLPINYIESIFVNYQDKKDFLNVFREFLKESIYSN